MNIIIKTKKKENSNISKKCNTYTFVFIKCIIPYPAIYRIDRAYLVFYSQPYTAQFSTTTLRFVSSANRTYNFRIYSQKAYKVFKKVVNKQKKNN